MKSLTQWVLIQTREAWDNLPNGAIIRNCVRVGSIPSCTRFIRQPNRAVDKLTFIVVDGFADEDCEWRPGAWVNLHFRDGELVWERETRIEIVDSRLDLVEYEL